jgi:tRNA threonylcarbamoyladenosine biosynthesis protein TsaE
MTETRSWKKVAKNDLPKISLEIEESLNRPAVVILTGVVGSGKTTFVQAFVKYTLEKRVKKEIDPLSVTSATYSVVNEVSNVCYGDFYRLKSPEELVHLELELYLDDKDFLFIEWGIEYIDYIKKIVGPDFSYYQLSFDSCEEDATKATRNLVLTPLEFY